jgi:hypothetical protein
MLTSLARIVFKTLKRLVSGTYFEKVTMIDYMGSEQASSERNYIFRAKLRAKIQKSFVFNAKENKILFEHQLFRPLDIPRDIIKIRHSNFLAIISLYLLVQSKYSGVFC